MRYISGRNYRPPEQKKGRFFAKRRSKRVKHPTSHVFAPTHGISRKHARASAAHIPWRQLFFATSFCAWVLLLVYLPYFRVNKISFSGLQLIKKDELTTLMQGTYLDSKSWFPKNNYFLMNPKSIEKFLVEKYSLSGAEVKKVFPNMLEITVHEKVTSIIYDDGSSYYLMDHTGTLVRKLTEVSHTEYSLQNQAPVLTNFNGETNTTTNSTTLVHIPSYQTIRRTYGLFPVLYQDPNSISTSTDPAWRLTADTVNGVIALYSALEDNNLATPNYVVMGESAAGAALISNKPWKIYFQPDGDIAAQMNTVKIILRDNKPTDYIDVRYGDHVYWK